jgi:benzoyl-CoA reductase/2-hydroxyglutaryl-CoA dehydratase subunit BcrC/BadD/HgdB
MFEKFQEVYEKRHDYAREWKKRTGGKFMGCFCSYCPEEIIYAADILPVRMLGSHEPQSYTEPYINENRRLMREVYELRKADDPPLTGLEAMYDDNSRHRYGGQDGKGTAAQGR